MAGSVASGREWTGEITHANWNEKPPRDEIEACLSLRENRERRNLVGVESAMTREMKELGNRLLRVR